MISLLVENFTCWWKSYNSMRLLLQETKWFGCDGLHSGQPLPSSGVVAQYGEGVEV